MTLASFVSIEQLRYRDCVTRSYLQAVPNVGCGSLASCVQMRRSQQSLSWAKRFENYKTSWKLSGSLHSNHEASGSLQLRVYREIDVLLEITNPPDRPSLWCGHDKMTWANSQTFPWLEGPGIHDMV